MKNKSLDKYFVLEKLLEGDALMKSSMATASLDTMEVKAITTSADLSSHYHHNTMQDGKMLVLDPQ
jgi:hypothetical protein